MSFSAQVKSFSANTSARMERIKRTVVVKLVGDIIRDTPVLTGRLRGNWQTSVASPLTGELPKRDPGAAIAEANAATEQATGDQAIYIRNNLPYAYRIEFDGWSHTKAPAGMLRKNVVRYQQIVDKAAREGKL